MKKKRNMRKIELKWKKIENFAETFLKHVIHRCILSKNYNHVVAPAIRFVNTLQVFGRLEYTPGCPLREVERRAEKAKMEQDRRE